MFKIESKKDVENFLELDENKIEHIQIYELYGGGSKSQVQSFKSLH